MSVTASKGIAFCLLENATTMYKWTGIGDGRHGVSELGDVEKFIAQYADVRKRVADTDV